MRSGGTWNVPRPLYDNTVVCVHVTDSATNADDIVGRDQHINCPRYLARMSSVDTGTYTDADSDLDRDSAPRYGEQTVLL